MGTHRCMNWTKAMSDARFGRSVPASFRSPSSRPLRPCCVFRIQCTPWPSRFSTAMAMASSPVVRICSPVCRLHCIMYWCSLYRRKLQSFEVEFHVKQSVSDACSSILASFWILSVVKICLWLWIICGRVCNNCWKLHSTPSFLCMNSI